jgi:hypothetical protein
MVNLQNKKILVFLPNGRGIYGKAIEKELIYRGATVYIHDERPSVKTVTKIAYRFAKKWLQNHFINYLVQTTESYKEIGVDYVLIIRAEAFTPKAMRLLKARLPKAHYILYLWDSVKNTHTSDIFPFFDRVLTFDKSDAEYYHITPRPLFFIDDYRAVAATKERDTDVLFIGKIHSDRFAFIKKLEKEFKSKGLKTFFYFYFPSRVNYWLKKLTSRSFLLTKISDFHFTTIPSLQAAQHLGKSKASLDSQHPAQTGLTMRSIEVFGAKRKLITTNEQIRSYDLYHPNNILVVDRKNPVIDYTFFELPYIEAPEEVYEKYSLQGWINELFKNK